MRNGLATLLLVISLGVFQSAQAQTANEETYSRYHQAIEAARLCRDLTFDQAQMDRMSAVISAAIGNDIGAKRLSLLSQAKRDARDLVDKKGCQSPEVQQLLALYDSDLAPVVQ